MPSQPCPPRWLPARGGHSVPLPSSPCPPVRTTLCTFVQFKISSGLLLGLASSIQGEVLKRNCACLQEWRLRQTGSWGARKILRLQGGGAGEQQVQDTETVPQADARGCCQPFPEQLWCPAAGLRGPDWQDGTGQRLGWGEALACHRSCGAALPGPKQISGFALRGTEGSALGVAWRRKTAPCDRQRGVGVGQRHKQTWQVKLVFRSQLIPHREPKTKTLLRSHVQQLQGKYLYLYRSAYRYTYSLNYRQDKWKHKQRYNF